MIVQDIIVNVIDNATASLKAIGNVGENVMKQVKDATEVTQGAMLGFGLSVLFTGLAIKRLAESSLRSLLVTYATIKGEHSTFVNQLNILIAHWEFLKYTIMDALVQSGLFTAIIAGIISLIDFVQQLPAPLLTAIAFALVFAAVMGTAMVVLGQATLVAVGFGTTLLSVSLALLGLYTLSLALFFIWTSNHDTITKVTASATVAFGVMAVFFQGAMAWMITGLLAFMGVLGLVPLAAATATIGMLLVFITVFALLMEKFGGFWNALKAFAGETIMLIAGAIQLVIKGITTGLNAVLVLIDNIIVAIAKRLANNPLTAALAKPLFDLSNGIESVMNTLGNVDILPTVAAAVDAAGLNPQAVATNNPAQAASLGQFAPAIPPASQAASGGVSGLPTAADIMNQQKAFQDQQTALQNQFGTPGGQAVTNNTFNIDARGADDGTIDKLIKELQRRYNFQNGAVKG